MINMSGKLNKILKPGLHDTPILRIVLSTPILKYIQLLNSILGHISLKSLLICMECIWGQY